MVHESVISSTQGGYARQGSRVICISHVFCMIYLLFHLVLLLGVTGTDVLTNPGEAWLASPNALINAAV